MTSPASKNLPQDLRLSSEETHDINSDLLAACKAVLACDTWHDHNGHAYLRVPARSIWDLAAQIAAIVLKAEGR